MDKSPCTVKVPFQVNIWREEDGLLLRYKVEVELLDDECYERRVDWTMTRLGAHRRAKELRQNIVDELCVKPNKLVASYTL